MNIFKIFSIMGSAGKSAQIVRKFKSGGGLKVERNGGLEGNLYNLYSAFTELGTNMCSIQQIFIECPQCANHSMKK